MRLIDADSIEWEYKCISKEEIDEQPTVEAIPVDWIKKQAFKNPALNRNLFYNMIIDEWRKKMNNLEYQLAVTAIRLLADNAKERKATDEMIDHAVSILMQLVEDHYVSANKED